MYDFLREKLFKSKTKEEAFKNFEITKDKFLQDYEDTKNLYTDLNTVRSNSSKKVFFLLKSYINNLANYSQDFDNSFTKLKSEIDILIKREENLNLNIDEAFQSFVSNVCGAHIAGAGFAVLSPTIATGLVSFLGTASTGTVISSLSGAAATNATLAWLGGGSIATGGAGIAGGKALLAFAGPIGWIVGLGLTSRAGYKYNQANQKKIEQANQATKKIKVEIEKSKIIKQELNILIDQTNTSADYIRILVEFLTYRVPSDYNDFRDWQKQEIKILIENINSFSTLLNQELDSNSK